MPGKPTAPVMKPLAVDSSLHVRRGAGRCRSSASIFCKIC
jgi:hypothetical protein